MDTAACRLAGMSCRTLRGNVGNPHIIFFVEDAGRGRSRPAGPGDRARSALPAADQRQRRSVQVARSGFASGSAAPASPSAAAPGACATAVRRSAGSSLNLRVGAAAGRGRCNRWSPGEPIRMSGGAIPRLHRRDRPEAFG
jgi:hypothetical protein